MNASIPHVDWYLILCVAQKRQPPCTSIVYWGCRLSLNFATLSNAANDIDSKDIDETRRFLFDHLSSFYQLKSLYQFNEKFAPEWCSRYLAYRDVLKIPKLALAIAQSGAQDKGRGLDRHPVAVEGDNAAPGVELDEFHVTQLGARPKGEGVAVPGGVVGIRGEAEGVRV